jgi:hypothetical protein
MGAGIGADGGELFAACGDQAVVVVCHLPDLDQADKTPVGPWFDSYNEENV